MKNKINMENLFRYNKRIYKTTEALVKAIRESHNGASDSLSDEYLINESYALGEWHHISPDDVIDRHNKHVSKNNKLKVKLKKSKDDSMRLIELVCYLEDLNKDLVLTKNQKIKTK